MKNKIVIYITAKGKSLGKSSRQRDKTKEIGAVKFNKKARKGKKKRDGESGRELKLAACLVVFFNFPSWLFLLSFSFSTKLSFQNLQLSALVAESAFSLLCAIRIRNSLFCLLLSSQKNGNLRHARNI